MPADLSDADRKLMTLFFKVVLMRYRAGTVTLQEALSDLANTFASFAEPGDDFRAYMQAAIEDHE